MNVSNYWRALNVTPEYDERANVTGLKRYGVIDRTDTGEETFGLLDDITAYYSGNRPTQIVSESDATTFAGRAACYHLL